jgi:secreted trypsin-like serine protease
LTARIIGGEESNVGEYTFSAAIYVQTNDSKFFCGGSLLNHDWIITSGNCVYNAVLFTIQLGSVYLNGENGNRQTVATSDYVLHPQFNPDTIENDIGLIKLRMSITFTRKCIK